ncbi:hypothetical protein [Rhizobium laguerreae]|uniref:hypothetical protein n=1 Tax=Rhizobium laguerreae TaxID=1076926 RepID=UPI001C929B88|nr:hypothetical protein [Rhizobium laguerreae]MBY3363747.1 hypothetical protein [Rhizobium laguerreae]
MIPNNGPLAHLFRACTEYTMRTGQDGFKLAPVHLFMRLRSLNDIERRDRENLFRSVSAAIALAFGEKKALDMIK